MYYDVPDWADCFRYAGTSIDVTDFFPESFMKEYSDFDSPEEFFRAAGIKLKKLSDAALPDSKNVEAVVKEHTEFGSWAEMLSTASDYYFANL